MKHYHITPRNWFLIKGKPRPVCGMRKQFVYAAYSSDHPEIKAFSMNEIEPLVIDGDLIQHSNLRNYTDDKRDVYNAIHMKHENIELPFVISFDYSSDNPCTIEFPTGFTLEMRYIHRLQQFILAVTGEPMMIKMHF